MRGSCVPKADAIVSSFRNVSLDVYQGAFFKNDGTNQFRDALSAAHQRSAHQCRGQGARFRWRAPGFLRRSQRMDGSDRHVLAYRRERLQRRRPHDVGRLRMAGLGREHRLCERRHDGSDRAPAAHQPDELAGPLCEHRQRLVRGDRDRAEGRHDQRLQGRVRDAEFRHAECGGASRAERRRHHDADHTRRAVHRRQQLERHAERHGRQRHHQRQWRS